MKPFISSAPPNRSISGLQLAKKLGLSHATVSFVLNGIGEKRKISKDTIDRVLAAARNRLEMPSYGSQLALSALTAAACLAAVILFHHHELAAADARNLAEWSQIVAAAQDLDAGAR
jgi:transcriptional regulator with XRE-family HTH domain